MNKNMKNNGFTLIEIIVVVVIMGIIASVAMRSIGTTLEVTKVETTKQELTQIAQAITGNDDLYSNGLRTDFGYVGDVGSLPSDLDDLVTNPGGYSTWNGPYLNNNFVEASDDYKRDSWGVFYTYNNVTIQSSGGGGGTITKQLAASPSALLSNTVTGYITDAAGNPPGDSASFVRIILTFPNGAGGTSDSTISVSATGAFAFDNTVPVGNHLVRAVYSSTNDTVLSYVSVLPGATAYTSLRLPGAPWASTGGGSTSGDLTYVSGSSSCTGGSNNNIEYSIYNNNSSPVNVDWCIINYSQTPTSYFERVQWGATTVFNSSSPRAASGDTISFGSTQSINPSSSKAISLDIFKDAQSGGGTDVDMSNVIITVKYSDGSVLTFNSGT